MERWMDGLCGRGMVCTEYLGFAFQKMYAWCASEGMMHNTIQPSPLRKLSKKNIIAFTLRGNIQYVVSSGNYRRSACTLVAGTVG